MSEAPPVEQPIVFPVMSGKRIRSHIWSLLLFGSVATCSGITVPVNLSRGRSITADIFFIIFGGFFFITSGYTWYRDQGARIQIQGNSISVISPTGATRINGLLSNVVELKAIQTLSQTEPNTYVVVFQGARRLSFDRNLPNLDGLLHLIQVRTGKQFTIHRS